MARLLVLFLLCCSCGSGVPPEALGGGREGFRQFRVFQGPSRAGDFSFKVCMTNVEGRDLVCTALQWQLYRVNNMESYVAREQKYTVLSAASSTVISNRYEYFETPKGAPVMLIAEVNSRLRGSSAYRALIRKRLDELFVKHYGAHAVGRKRAVDEQLKTTWKGERDSLPRKRLVWRFSVGKWTLHGKVGSEDVRLSGKMPRALLFPLGLRLRLLRQSAGNGVRHPVTLLLPWVSRKPVDARLEIRRTSAAVFSCVFSAATIGTNNLLFTTNRMFATAYRGNGWRMEAVVKVSTNGAGSPVGRP